ncbi:MAG: preprotein translocase subunit SecA [Patescibacteria group bacterium]|nr:preprotein translocase subunit SecA [Patescibacteria group bacterium]
MSFLTKIFGDPNEKVVEGLLPEVEKINQLEEKYSKMSDEELAGQTLILKECLGEVPEINDEIKIKLDEILPDAFAVMREAAKRKINQRHFDVQLMGGIVLHRGQIAEMKTGEGKTLVATLPLYLNALTGKGVQLVTVNDYLSRVGAGWMAPIFNFLGLSVGVIVNQASFIYDADFINEEEKYDERLAHFRKAERQEAYACDIVYGTNNEFGFDYLRDNMVPSQKDKVQRGLNFAIVDEIDSILIDEARTPLIISAPAEESTDKYYKFADLVRRLKENEDYNVDEKMRTVTLSESGIEKMEGYLGIGNIYVEKGIGEVHHIEQALKAEVLFKEGKDYVVKNGEVLIVDEFTGRLMPGRRYSEGLHQAIEAKEGQPIQRESQTLATITFQNYFRMYKKLAGMTGTAVTEAEEFAKIYKLEVAVMPTNKPMVRNDLNDLVYKTELAKFQAVIKDIKDKHEKGQPVLVGTISIQKNELLSELMVREGLNPEFLNAKNHEREARIISQAGKLGAITVATNMAGRGVDIILGGQMDKDMTPEEVAAWKEESEKVKALGGLYVIGTERHEARRIDNQLRGRAGRQGDPGMSRFYLSCEDDLMRIFGGDRMKKLMTTLRLPEDMPIENRMITGSIETAQKKVEANNFDLRKHLVEYDDVINKHRETIYRRRDEILAKAETEPEKLSELILEMVEGELEQVVFFHTAADDIKSWNIKEIYETVNTIFPVKSELMADLSGIADETKKLEKALVRTKIIEHLIGLAGERYGKMTEDYVAAGLDWRDIEKNILLRSIDSLWVDHLDSMDFMRRGIGLRGYGQRDPLVEYKKEAFRMFSELNNLIQKEVVYGIYKFGSAQGLTAMGFSAPNLLQRARTFSAPAKTAEASAEGRAAFDNVKQKTLNAEGEKVGRNDPCPCGAKKPDGTPVKYKNCCGK